jgi:hypothetical protein
MAGTLVCELASNGLFDNSLSCKPLTAQIFRNNNLNVKQKIFHNNNVTEEVNH